MILVVGATGLLGNEVCRQLLKRGEKVRALVRSTSDPAKVAALHDAGADIALGDLKDPPSLAAACQGVDTIISTASSTFFRQDGDSIETVDHLGQLNLIDAAKNARINRFVFVSFRVHAGFHFPLGDAKTAVEQALEDLNYTVLRASWFMEVWLSPALGFDYPNAAATVYGPGTCPISFVSYLDLAEMCALAANHPAAERKTLDFGGPTALTPLEVIAKFEQIAGKPFTIQHVPQEALQAQFDSATDPMQKSFAALTLGYCYGDAMDMAPLQQQFSLKLTSVDDYARRVLGSA
jgi:uncharacterized protein YbjT (DUF2867 family)